MIAPHVIKTPLTPLQVVGIEQSISKLEEELLNAEYRALGGSPAAIQRCKGIQQAIDSHWKKLIDGGYAAKFESLV